MRSSGPAATKEGQRPSSSPDGPGTRRRALTREDLYAAIMEGAVERVRPKMMTVVAITAGLLPILWSTCTGSEVMRRIAVPMIGGMVSSTILTLVVIPAVYALVKGLRLPKLAGCAKAHGWTTVATVVIDSNSTAVVISTESRFAASRPP